VPLVNSYNSLAQADEMPVFQCLWEPYAISPSSTSAITLPTAAGAGGLVPGALMTFTTAGVGSNPPLGFGQGISSGGDRGSSGNTTFPFNWSVPYVDLSPVSASIYVAGVLLGVGSIGLACPAVPNTVGSTNNASFVAMVGRTGLAQVLVDNTTTIGHTVIPSTTSTHTGQASDSGGTTWTYGTTIGVALQAVTITTGPKPCWINLNVH
jgi:hypothetical protein